MEGILWHMPIPFQNPHLTPPSLEINYHSLTTELNVFSEDMVDPDAGGVVDKKLAKNVGYTTKGDIFNSLTSIMKVRNNIGTSEGDGRDEFHTWAW